MRVTLLIRALSFGGAERQLLVLADGLRQRGHEVQVLTFYRDGTPRVDLQRVGVQVGSANKQGRWDMAGFMVRLLAELRAFGPGIVYSSMPTANIVSSLVGRFAGSPRVAWRLASSDMDLGRYDAWSRISYRIEAFCSGIPGIVVANSFAGREAAIRRGFSANKIKVVWNGIETDRFFPNSPAGEALRNELGIDRDKWIIGQVARADPKKGYEDFLDAAGLLRRHRSDVEFLCVGAEPSDYTRRLQERAARNGIAACVKWRHSVHDMTAVYNAMNINTLASRFGEGCPNAVAEAMACGVPCVVTDIGDSARIVGATGEVVPPESPRELMQAWTRLLDRLKENRDTAMTHVRERVTSKLSVKRYIEATERTLLELS